MFLNMSLVWHGVNVLWEVYTNRCHDIKQEKLGFGLELGSVNSKYLNSCILTPTASLNLTPSFK